MWLRVRFRCGSWSGSCCRSGSWVEGWGGCFSWVSEGEFGNGLRLLGLEASFLRELEG